MAEEQENRAGEHAGGEPQSDFKLLKDDYVDGVGESTPQIEEAPQSTAVEPVSPFAEVDPPSIEIPASRLKWSTRRDFLVFGVGAVATAGALWWLLPFDPDNPTDPTSIKNRIVTPAMRKQLDSLTARAGLSARRHSTFYNRVLTFDDDVAEALYSPTRSVPTYRRADITPNLRNNYDGQTPDDSYIDDWKLVVSGLALGKDVVLTAHDLLTGFGHHEQITRLCCVEGWSAIAGWGGLRFADFLNAYPPAPGMRWASIRSEVNLDADGNSDPYYVSIDLSTARHPQTLLATHLNGKPLDVDHGAPLRLVAPMKLGLKNIKAITSIAYTANEPADYWNDRGYSKYDGI